MLEFSSDYILLFYLKTTIITGISKAIYPKKQNPPLINQGWEKIAMKKKNITKIN